MRLPRLPGPPWRGRAGGWRGPVAAGLLALAVGAAVVAALPGRTVVAWRESAADAVLAAAGPTADDGVVVVVAIDAASLAAVGPWPWPREITAELVEAVAAGGPRAIGVDVVFAGPDRASPARLAAILAAREGRDDLVGALAALPDPDERLAGAMAAAPTVAAFLLGGGDAGPSTPVLVSGAAPTLAPWAAAGAVTPLAVVADNAAGLGAASLEADGDGVVRRVPLLVAVGDAVAGGLAAETLRIGEGAAAFVVESDTLAIGPRRVPLGREATLRFRPSPPALRTARTVAASDVLAGRIDAARFADRLVLIGGAAPELGALRATAADPVAPSVQIQADALGTLLSGRVPHRPETAWIVEIVAAGVLAALGLALGATVGPLPAAAATIAAGTAWSGGAVAALAWWDRVVDPIGPPLAGLVAVVAAGTAAAVSTRRQAAALRRRFEQHLAPAVVARIAARPDLVKLDGERREVTALFTDVEGFTAVTDRVGPTELVRLLDGYFAGVVEIVTGHGGMIDKIVGDAVHALFNAPVDLPDHPRRAVEAARAVVAFGEAFRARPDAAAAGFGRTRVGVETGEVVIGDVGAGGKLDYTAHGAAVNTAARLEALNKELGTAICVGPTCRARLPDLSFRALGAREIRGRGTLELFTPAEGP
ncbi:CHASE2 domain-containing protein [Oharaeibacter diazotrophicus]|uniref:Adenylate cyclase n=2 Tax=Oharaeibacter diazotrophicus TaxID=1920512 RepID=A0A4R6RJK2_9HYPH|nr:adenylate/guanylate cyclase domain-containing protein [Oharaeibacter diazotrophicus]TDP86592.1 adenylate cyclase [Oharaeibacter diazotrophicus]BBE71466.1 adenylate cyclase 1 [Pleomorphomonas sp. SM30]GLS78226.1 adenylate/guanylate cyclase domain-containing protein [Oharaeibacter diazotrophicus]